MDSVIQFMQSVTGKTIRIVIGIILLALGLYVMQGGFWGIVVALIGLVPLAGGLFGFTVIAPLFGYTLTGHRRVGHVSS